jgi:futalosine hydrolase
MPTPDLILIPTSFERDHLLADPGLSAALSAAQTEVAVCGFGPIAAAASTARLLSTRRTKWVILAGIAGSYGSELPLGSAWQVERVGSWGIGVGSGSDFRLGWELGWNQVSSPTTAPKMPMTNPGAGISGVGISGVGISGVGISGVGSLESGEVIPLYTAPLVRGGPNAGLSLTCTAASNSAADCELRRRNFPQAVFEEMEGFGVALACLEHQKATGQAIASGMVRGVSNVAGDRNKAHWQIAPALAAVAELLLQILTQDSAPVLSS